VPNAGRSEVTLPTLHVGSAVEGSTPRVPARQIVCSGANTPGASFGRVRLRPTEGRARTLDKRRRLRCGLTRPRHVVAGGGVEHGLLSGRDLSPSKERLPGGLDTLHMM